MNGPRVGALGLLLITAASGVSDARLGGLAVAAEEPAVAREPEGLRFRLSEGAVSVEGAVQIARPAATRLDEAATRRVLDRLPPWTEEAQEEAFARREDSLPPPRTGKTVRAAFPPPESPERPEQREGGPLEVVRRAPEGEVPLAPHFSVTFSTAMVAAAAHDELAHEAPPVRLSPEPPGEWRWVGTRTVLFEPEGRFPMATGYRVEVPAGTRAANRTMLASGVAWSFSTPPPHLVRHPLRRRPRVTDEPQGWSFRTYGPFRVRDHECGWGRQPCSPNDPWQITFNNPVNAKTFREDMVTVDPETPGLKAAVHGDTLVLHGSKTGRARYRVTLSPEMRDAFGQALEGGPALSFDVGPADKALFAPGGDFVVLDPEGGARLAVFSVNHAALRVEAWAVGPEDWAEWHACLQSHWRNRAAAPPGRLVLDTTVRTEGSRDELIETRLDLSPALDDGLGQLVLIVQPAKPGKEDQNQGVWAWVQSTRIGLDAFADGQTLLAWATGLEDGRPLADAEVSLVPGPTVRTDSAGLARLGLAETPAPLLVARRGEDLALLPSDVSWWNDRSGWKRHERLDAFRFYVFDDRQVYRPGEEVRA